MLAVLMSKGWIIVLISLSYFLFLPYNRHVVRMYYYGTNNFYSKGEIIK